MAERSHVPKFGNWDGDNVPYTVFFENARKEKAAGGGVRINPNDPEQNPNLFHHQYSSSAANSVLNNNRKSRQRKKMSSDGRQPPRSPFRLPNNNKPSSRHASEDFSGRSVSVPKFGVWDETDPRSADGFTVIFNKVKEEKQIASARFPTAAAPPPWTSSGDHRRMDLQNKTRSKRCCFLF